MLGKLQVKMNKYTRPTTIASQARRGLPGMNHSPRSRIRPIQKNWLAIKISSRANTNKSKKSDQQQNDRTPMNGVRDQECGRSKSVGFFYVVGFLAHTLNQIKATLPKPSLMRFRSGK